MGELKGFLKYKRETFKKEKIERRIDHWKEFTISLKRKKLQEQAARCMDCGVPFCQSGCPVSNVIPDWNDLVYNNNWEEAYKRLVATNNFPEFTGRVCPAPCENSCVLGFNDNPVTIKQIELEIIEIAFKNNYVKKYKPKIRTDKRIAVVGSGPAGLACAEQLNKEGHQVTIYEKNELPGGLLTFGIPNFKLEKWVVKRRIDLMEESGIKFKTGVTIGKDISISRLQESYDAVVLCGGAEKPRDLRLPGRELKGIHFAMEYLTQQNRINLGQNISDVINAKDKDVIVIGGGDTGSDCIGTAIRQGAKSVTNIELLPKRPSERGVDNPWPQWANIDRISSSHEEGCVRHFSFMTKRFLSDSDQIKNVEFVKTEWQKDNGSMAMNEIENSEFVLRADLVLLAMGFVSPYTSMFTKDVEIELDDRGNIKADENYMTNAKGIFAAGDMRRGQSLVVWAINDGRNAAESINKYLTEIR